MQTPYDSPAWHGAESLHPGGLALTQKMLSASGLASGHILDFGCGRGFSSRFLLDQGFCVCGADPSLSLLNEAKQLCPDGHFVQLADPALSFPDSQFEGILCECVLSSVPDQKKSLKELYRVLKGDGRVLLSDLCSLEVAGPFSRIAWRKLFRAAGFAVIEFSLETNIYKKFLAKWLWEEKSLCSLATCLPDSFPAHSASYFSAILTKSRS